MKAEPESKIRVLVVDDDPGIIKVVGIMLKVSGYGVLSTTSGAEAIEIARTQKPDVLLLDVVMPGVTGLEVLDRVRSFSHVPVIIFSGNQTIAKLALKAGANDSIAKPFDPDLLIAKIASVLRVHRVVEGSNGSARHNPARG
jgi:two-component system, OmpR family, response regulator MtrA